MPTYSGALLPVIPPVVNPEEVIYISPSQVSQFVECKRKWGWRYLERLEAPQHPSAALGERVHKILEDWLQFGAAPNTEEVFEIQGKAWYPGRAAYSGIHHLPKPGSPMDVEYDFRLNGWRGKIDLAHEMTHPEHGHIHVVHDHKSTKDLNYAKTPDDLKQDAQGLIYAMVGLEASGAQKVLDRWVYFQTKPPYKNAKTEVVMTKTMVEDGMVFWDDQASMIRHLRRQKPPVLSLEPAPEMCNRYGGCPYQQNCNLSPEEKARGFFMSEMSIEEKIRKMKEEKANGNVQVAGAQQMPPLPQVPPLPQQQVPPLPTQQVPPLPTPQVAHPLDSLDPATALAFVNGLKVGQFFGSAPHPMIQGMAMAKGLSFVDQGGSWAVRSMTVQILDTERAGQINPPEKPAAPKTSIDTAETETADASSVDQFDKMDKHDLEAFIKTHGLSIETKRKQAKTIAKLVRAAWKDREIAASNPDVAAQAQAQAQKDAETVSQQVAPPIPQQVPAIPQQVAPPIPQQVAPPIPQQVAPPVPQQVAPPIPQPPMIQAPPQQVAPTLADIKVYIDCLPMGVQTLTASQAFPEAFRAVCADQNVPDFRMVEYGKGPGLLAAAVRHAIQTGWRPAAPVVISSSTAEGGALRDVLVQYAAEVVVGTA